MQIILQEDIPTLGKAGEVVSVREGYGRNCLLPQKKAVVADPKNLNQLEHQKRVVAKKMEKKKGEAELIAEKLRSVSLNIAMEAGEEDRLFGAVTTKDIANALRKEEYIIDRHNIDLKEPIKQLGTFDIPIKLHSDVIAVIKVSVVKK